MDFKKYPDAELMMVDLANQLAGNLENALLTHERVSFAVPGGTTPGPVYDTLCAVDLGWDRIDVMLTDERWVPETSKRSNTRLLRERLLIDKAAAATLIPLYVEAPKPEDKLTALAAVFESILPISVMLLGMGSDMHTASIFPQADQLENALYGTDNLVAMRAPGATEPRITMSAKVLKGAMCRHIVIIGDEKRAALDRASHLTPTAAPVAAVLSGSTLHWARN